YEVQVAQSSDFDVPTNIVASADALFAYYVPWQGRRDPMPDGVYWWRVRAMNAQDQPLGAWTESRNFLIAQDLMTGNVIDYKAPAAGTLLDAGELYDPALSLVATSAITKGFPFDVGQVHIIQDRSQAINNYRWMIAFGADDAVEGQLSY